MPTAKEPRPAVEPLALGPASAAAAIGISRDLLDSLEAQGKTPAPIKLGSRKIYNRRELQSWLDSGAPDRAAWERLKNNAKK